jgi:hypothetical protein
MAVKLVNPIEYLMDTPKCQSLGRKSATALAILETHARYFKSIKRAEGKMLRDLTKILKEIEEEQEKPELH